MSKPAKTEIENINTPGRTSRVDSVKYDAMRKLILSITPTTAPGLTAKEMVEKMKPLAPQALWPNGEKIGWWQKTVQLDLEAKKLIVRDSDSKPLRWYATR
ncbi:DUF6958 family protein [Rubellicoccus peritrichatus]|uniref:Uncharacterized protein n=1 Tax=Rubellicoccus peritrichatus TaxID=3080537 RepID=A0AAQ3QSX6_9BACT|nr:hypothetical protein [Puniceicoccus sp. CR14]WOO43073.1 hypothetical protein RZN69_08200 [Puniceicoccus sp. CR14]